MWRRCLKPAEIPYGFLVESSESSLSSAMAKSYLAARFACNRSNRGKFAILGIVLVEHMMVPRQCKLQGDAGGGRLYVDRPHRTT